MTAILANIEFIGNDALIHFPHRFLRNTDEEKADKMATEMNLDYIFPENSNLNIIFVPRNSATLVKSPITPDSWNRGLLNMI
jgi:hypothetical protein